MEEALKRQGVSVHCVLKSSVEEEERRDFVENFWKKDERCYLDKEMRFLKFVQGGELRKKKLWWVLLNPFEFLKLYRNYKCIGDRVPRNNLKGEGLVLGGLLIAKKGGEIVFTHREKTFGDCATEEEILEAAKRISSAG